MHILNTVLQKGYLELDKVKNECALFSSLQAPNPHILVGDLLSRAVYSSLTLQIPEAVLTTLNAFSLIVPTRWL